MISYLVSIKLGFGILRVCFQNPHPISLHLADPLYEMHPFLILFYYTVFHILNAGWKELDMTEAT